MTSEPSDVIRLYLDDDKEPFKTARPPLKFQFSTLHLADGPHRLRVEAHNGLAGDAVREIPFLVRNGVAITVSGIDPGQEIAGQVGVVINAWAGNQEVDFEPSRAETPQPIPTWAWLIFLAIVAWTMFYVLNPAVPPAAVAAATAPDRVGERVFADACAKCHQEDGRGLPEVGPAPLRPPPGNKPWNEEGILSEDPTELLSTIVAGPFASPGASSSGARSRRFRMPAWGMHLSTDEIVAVVNKLRSSWGNQAPLLTAHSKRPPQDVDDLEKKFVAALQQRSVEVLAECISPSTDRPPRLVRPERGTDSRVDVAGRDGIVETLAAWLQTFRGLNSMTPVNTTWIEVPGGNVVVAHGTVILNLARKEGGTMESEGRFLRTYRKETFRVKRTIEQGGNLCEIDADEPHWVIAFDFADTPMPLGCEPRCPESIAASMDYAQVQDILRRLGQLAPNAPHGNFWERTYEEFKALEFTYKFPDHKRTGTIRMINVGPGIAASDVNLVKGLRDGKDVLVEVDGRAEPEHVDVERMPKGGKPISVNDLARITAWVERGMPEHVAAATPKRVEPPPAMAESPPAMAEAPPAMAETPPAMAETPPAMAETPPAATAAGDWLPDDVDFAGVIALLTAIHPKASSAPHGSFWKKSYADFVDFSFDLTTGEGKVRFIEKGKGAESNLVKALLGQPLTVDTPDGKRIQVDIGKVMPPKGERIAPADVERIRRWIDHGAPEKKPAPGEAPPAPPTEPPPTAPPAPPSSPPSPPPAPPDTAAAPGSGGGEWTADDVDFAGVQAILAKIQPKAGGAPHGTFWKRPYEEFVDFSFDLNTGEGKVRLIEKGNGAGSNLVHALSGQPLSVVTPEGKTIQIDIGKVMPPKGQKVAPEDVEKIRRWIDHGAPKERPK